MPGYSRTSIPAGRFARPSPPSRTCRASLCGRPSLLGRECHAKRGAHRGTPYRSLKDTSPKEEELLPKSRKRKTRRGGASSRSTYSSKNKPNQMTKAIAFLIIAALAVAAVLFILFRGGAGGGGSTPGGEVTTASGLRFIDEVVGTGDSPKPGRNVTVHYTGTLENGTKFDSSVDRGQPYPFRIGTGTVIKG